MSKQELSEVDDTLFGHAATHYLLYLLSMKEVSEDDRARIRHILNNSLISIEDLKATTRFLKELFDPLKYVTTPAESLGLFRRLILDKLVPASASAATNSNESTASSTSLAHFLEVENIGYIIDPRDRQNVLQKDDNKEVTRQVQDLVLGQQRVLHYVILDKKNRKMVGGKLSRNVHQCVCCHISKCSSEQFCKFTDATCCTRFHFEPFITNDEMVLQYESEDGPRQQRMELEKPVELRMKAKSCECELCSFLYLCCGCCPQMRRFVNVQVKIFPYLIFVQPPHEPPTAPPNYMSSSTTIE